MKRIAAGVLALVLVGACASETTPSGPEVAATDDGASETPNATQSGRDKNAGKKGDGKRRGTEADGKKGSRNDGAGTGDAENDDSAPGSNPGGGPAPYPAAGTYTFAQSGFEEFCNTAGQCEREKLPPRQPTRLEYSGADNDSALVVMEQRLSDARVARTWTRFTPAGAHVVRAYVKFEYSGFTFERTYEPEPPVEALRFPLRDGEAWSGRWRAETSGSYSAKVGSPQQVQAGDRTVSAYPIQTTMEFRGDFEGRSRITTYIDPDTKAIVATEGALNVTSRFGRYSTVFEARLAGGPRY